MRLIVMFDLPVETSKDRREYYKFRKHLIRSGFLMLQESIYCKLTQNSSALEGVVDNIYKNKPPKGSVIALRVTEKQYAKMEYVIGDNRSDVLNTDDRLIIL